MKYILRIKKKFPKCPKLPIKSQVAPVDGILKVIMVSIINRTEEDQTKIIDKGVKNKFKWSWLEKFVTVEIEKKSHKIMLADCIEIVL